MTLAHLGRPLALIGALDGERYDVTLLCSEQYANFVARSSDVRRRDIYSISPQQFTEALAQGRPIYDVATLERYVTDDLALLTDLRPDVVVGDFRLSLSASARIAGVPYVTIASAYWSPYGRPRFTIPEHPMVRVLGVSAAQRMFDLVRPFVFAYHAVPLNRVRRRYGLASLGSDLRRAYTDADVVLYADPPELVPIDRLPETHRYLGPVLWSPAGSIPPWWSQLPNDKPIIYITMGSSGRASLLEVVLSALAGAECTIIAATAGHSTPQSASTNAFVADYVPGEEAARRAKLVICNGGSPTSHQALAAGVPVLGIPGNMDQHLNMQGIEHAGAGVSVRSDQASVATITAAVRRVLETPSYSEAAKRLAAAFRRHDARQVFATTIARMLAGSTTARQETMKV